MTNIRASVLERHRELSHSFALVAPLGGGAVMALHALQQDDARTPFGAPPGAPVSTAPFAPEPAPSRRQHRWAVNPFAWT